jgi:predicted RNA polymerase sigma factor
MTDRLRSDSARVRREDMLAAAEPRDSGSAADVPAGDDTLVLLLLCCHPALTPGSQVALALRAVGGLRTVDIAAAFMVPEATMGQRISRAKARLRAVTAPFAMPSPAELRARLAVAMEILYLIFNEGYTATTGASAQRRALAAEAIRLTRVLHRILPDDGDGAGLLALMLLTDARRDARTDAAGDLIPLAEQDRGRWDHAQIEEGRALAERALTMQPVGRYAIQAAITAVHADATSPDDTDWVQILHLYEILLELDDNPVVQLNRAVAEAMVHGAERGLARLDTLSSDPTLAAGHRFDAVRAHLLADAGRSDEAIVAYRRAAARTLSVPEQRYLTRRAAALERAL